MSEDKMENDMAIAVSPTKREYLRSLLHMEIEGFDLDRTRQR